MKTIIIGSGNVAYHLAKAFTQSGIPTELFGRNNAELALISNELGVKTHSENLPDTEFYLIAVSDSAVSEVSNLIKKKDCLVAHTSGSLPMDALVGDYRKSVFYPLQTFSKLKNLDYSEIPFFIEAGNADDEASLKSLAQKISKNVMVAASEKRKYIHLTAVFACNFVNHLFARAKEISDAQNIPFDYFLPLIDETVAKIHKMDPKLAQTGPAVRGDRHILELHEHLISGEFEKIYKTMNESIQKMYFENM